MPRQRILDSHIHLWPASAANPSSHAWMTPGAHLAKQYSVSDYLSASTSPDAVVEGFVYVETDRRVGGAGDDNGPSENLEAWAEPLEELRWLRRIVEGTPEEAEGFSPGDGRLMKGIVAWAPLDRGPDVFEEVKGFRFLLQGIKEEATLRELVLGEGFVGALRRFRGEGRDSSFDVGVDMRGAGVWQLEVAAEMIVKVNEGMEKNGVRFILNHLCKPSLEDDVGDDNRDWYRWCAAITRFAGMHNVYMKLSGGFSEMEDQNPSHPMPITKVVTKMRPWLSHLFTHFPHSRILFGSDWPVCNVRGPGDELSWKHWRGVVEQILEEYNLSEREKNRIWYGTAVEAYRLDMSH
ncbi:L-rhamnono-gamma-lactonase [Coniosporium tulheliwenetii]|uniref:L-rhamnono-gamma-lactonase n=1 Tax=Coniosporium tulheliwenetii TaxID=3383036 RepID=A0ACC2ZFY2_9PEZI|nr:L-rhamnono-gamma-lactonase [Cladosporium sp. JES 115]